MSDVGRYRKTYARLWRHPGFVALTEGERLLVLYVLTGPQTNRLGLYVLSVATAAEELGTTPETLKKRLANVCQTFGWLFDSVARVVYVPSWFKWNPPENVNVLKGSLKDLNEIPPCGLVDAFSRNVETLPVTLHETFIEGLRQRLHKRSLNQDQYPDLNPKPEQKQHAPRGSDEKADRVAEALVDIARETLRMTNPHAAIDELIDAFHHVGGAETHQHKRATITKAFAIALSERREAMA